MGAETLAVAALAAGAAETFVGSRQKQAALEFQAAVNEQEARRAADRGALAERRTRRENSARNARQRALAAASGGDPWSGSALLALGDSAKDAELDALLARADGLAEAARFRRKAALDRSAGAAAARSGALRTARTLLTASSRRTPFGAPGGIAPSLY